MNIGGQFLAPRSINTMSNIKQSQFVAGENFRDADKLAFISVKIVTSEKETTLKKPSWLKVKLPRNTAKVVQIKQAMCKHNLSSVCEEASRPNLKECFNHGTATFMIFGAICTSRCPFCDVAHGRFLPVSAEDPDKLVATIRDMKLKYVVITSVDRDDLRDGGAKHFVDCINAIRKQVSHIKIEILVPDFKGRIGRTLIILSTAPPDVFNHNLDTAPHMDREVRQGANYKHSLELLRRFKVLHPQVSTKSGLMLSLGETKDEITAVLKDLREHNVDMLTLGQYLQPSKYHLAVKRFPLKEFDQLGDTAKSNSFTHAASGPLVH